MIYIYPYKLGSTSARDLRNVLANRLGKRPILVRPDGRFRPRRDDLVINWGNTHMPNWHWGTNDLNGPFNVAAACNKLDSFKVFKTLNVQTPLWTEDRNEAQNWVNSGNTVVVRTILNGHSGQGIRLVSEGEVQAAPLYVQYKKKRHEFRVHVFQGSVLDVVQKRRRNRDERPETFNNQIRSYDNGWVFCRDNVTRVPEMDSLAISAVSSLGLDFGAVDIIYNESENQYYVLEVNTAPGIEGTTLQLYADKIASLIQ